MASLCEIGCLLMPQFFQKRALIMRWFSWDGKQKRQAAGKETHATADHHSFGKSDTKSGLFRH
jgi:hypothetical protein